MFVAKRSGGFSPTLLSVAQRDAPACVADMKIVATQRDGFRRNKNLEYNRAFRMLSRSAGANFQRTSRIVTCCGATAFAVANYKFGRSCDVLKLFRKVYNFPED